MENLDNKTSKREHWSEEFSLFEAMKIAELVNYEVEPEIFDKRDFILDLACHIIQHESRPRGCKNDAVRQFLARCQAGAGRC